MLSAVDRSVTCRFERNCILLSAFSTGYFKAWSFSLHASLFQSSILGTSDWCILKAFLCVELLLRRSPDECITTVSTRERLILKICHLGITSFLQIFSLDFLSDLTRPACRQAGLRIPRTSYSIAQRVNRVNPQSI